MKRLSLFLIPLLILSTLLAGCAAQSTPITPTPLPVIPTTEGPSAGGGSGLDPAMIGEIDEQLNQAMLASIAFNDAPSEMLVDQTIFLTLLLSPSLSPEELAQQIEQNTGGLITVDSILVTPFMRADLQSDNPDAFKIVAIPNAPEQLVSSLEPTRWGWGVTALKPGDYTLRLTLSRLVVFQGEETWRPVKAYAKDMHISITLQQRLARFDWKWLIGLLLTAVIPLYWRWQDRKNKT